MTRKSIWIPLVSLLFLASCNSDPLDVDASGVQVDIAFTDVNKVLIETDSAELLTKHHEFQESIGNIYNYLMGYCLRIGSVNDSVFYDAMIDYRLDPGIQQMNKDMDSLFSDKKKMEETITDGFRHLKYHLPDCHLPKNIVFINTLFQSGVFCTEDEIGIGMQQYLGKDNEIVKQLNPDVYYNWMKEAFDIRYVERDVLTGWIETHCVDEVDGSLAEHIVRWGKVLYLTEAAYPDVDESIILRYSKEDMEWAKKNEYAFWKYLVDEKILFKIDERTTRNMVGDGPFTPGLPEDGSPDRMGQFLGWRMVHSYMEQFDISVKELIALPYNDILQEYEID